MAIALTKSYTKVAETKMGYWHDSNGNKLGTLYLRTYSRFNSDNNIDIQSRVYNNGTYCYSGNCYATLQGASIKNNVRLDFTGKSEIVLGTKTVAGGTVKAIATFRCYGLGLNNTFTAQAEVTLPSDKATGLDFDIGSATIITVTRYNDNYTRSVVASIGTFRETLMEKGTDTQVAWQPDVNSLYEQVPNTNTGTITLTTTTYDGDKVIGTATSTLKCRVTDSNPVINSVAITDSLEIVASNVLVRYLSKPKFEIDAEALNGASLVNYSVTELNSAEKTSESNEITTENTMTNNSFLVKVTDSRGNTTSANFSAEKFIEYILPAISKLDLVRTGENLDQIQASISGVWFKDPINNNDNTISLKYRYKTSNGEYSDYIDIEEVPTDSQFTIDTLLNPNGGFDTNSVYTIEVVATDNLTSGNLTNLIGKAVPLIDHWEENDKDYYNINAEIQQYGKPVVNMPKLLWSGTCDVGNTVELADNIKNYESLHIKTGSNLTYAICPVISNTTAVRGVGAYTGTNNIEIVSVRATCASNSFKLDNIQQLKLATSGNSNVSISTITEIWGIV